MEKLLSIVDLFRKGSAVDDPSAWKNKQISATMLGVAIVAAVRVAKAFGYDLPIDEDTSTAIAGGIIAAVNVVLTYVTSDKVGVLPAKADNTASTEDTPSVLSVPSTIIVSSVNEASIKEAKAALEIDRGRQSHTSLFNNR